MCSPFFLMFIVWLQLLVNISSLKRWTSFLQSVFQVYDVTWMSHVVHLSGGFWDNLASLIVPVFLTTVFSFKHFANVHFPVLTQHLFKPWSLSKRLTQLRTPSPSVIPSCLKSHTQNLAVIYFTSKHFMQGFAKLYKLQFEADIQKLW